MALKIKGIRKGLRYIGHIFDPKEHEMQIGFPTDVKHVAHIGWEGPSVNTPSWMKEFHSAPLSATVAPDRDGSISSQWSSQDFSVHSAQDSPISSPIPRPRRRASATSNAPNVDSPGGDPSGAAGSSRRQQLDADESVASSVRDRRRSRRQRHRSIESDGGGLVSPSKDLPAIPKQSRPRKPKLRSDAPESHLGLLPDTPDEPISSELKPTPQEEQQHL